tara:strand:- start:3337 stop:3546 length:210 start_codon:yes stop_codon:yes gene_type:complete
MENQYATRIERLIDEQLLEEAESIIHEMTVTEEDFLHDDLFLDDLTEWTEDDMKGIYFTNLEDIDIDNG